MRERIDKEKGMKKRGNKKGREGEEKKESSEEKGREGW